MTGELRNVANVASISDGAELVVCGRAITWMRTVRAVANTYPWTHWFNWWWTMDDTFSQSNRFCKYCGLAIRQQHDGGWVTLATDGGDVEWYGACPGGMISEYPTFKAWVGSNEPGNLQHPGHEPEDALATLARQYEGDESG